METMQEHRTQVRIGTVTYSIEVATMPGADGDHVPGQRVVVSLGGSGQDGEVVADGQLEVKAGSVSAVGRLLADTLRSVGGYGAGGRASWDRPTNQGQPWTEAMDAELEQRWIAGESAADIAARFERTQGAIRRRLPLVGCDPDKEGAYLPAPPSRRDA